MFYILRATVGMTWWIKGMIAFIVFIYNLIPTPPFQSHAQEKENIVKTALGTYLQNCFLWKFIIKTNLLSHPPLKLPWLLSGVVTCLCVRTHFPLPCVCVCFTKKKKIIAISKIKVILFLFHICYLLDYPIF